MAAPSASIPKLAEDVDRSVDIDYPPILERDVGTFVGAVTSAYDRQLIPHSEAARLVMTALGCNNVDQLLADLQAEEPREKPQPAGFGAELGEALRRILSEAVTETSSIDDAIDAMPEERRKEIKTVAGRMAADLKTRASERGKAIEDISNEEWEKAQLLDTTTEEL